MQKSGEDKQQFIEPQYRSDCGKQQTGTETKPCLSSDAIIFFGVKQTSKLSLELSTQKKGACSICKSVGRHYSQHQSSEGNTKCMTSSQLRSGSRSKVKFCHVGEKETC